MTLAAGDLAGFIRANTEIMSPTLVAEVRLHLATELVPLWEKTEEELGRIGLPPPFWAFAWAGGQALARYILDHPENGLLGELSSTSPRAPGWSPLLP